MLAVFRMLLKCEFNARICGRIRKYFISCFNFAIGIKIVNIEILNDQ